MPEDNKEMHFLDAETVISARLPRAWAAVSRRIAELEAVVENLTDLIEDLNGHEGAEGWSKELYPRIEAALAAQEARNDT